MDDKITIEIHHDYYRIYPYKFQKWNRETKEVEGTCPELDKKFMIFDRMYHHYSLDLDIYDKKNKELRLPIGVNKEFIEEKLYNNNVEYEEIDKNNEFPIPREVNDLYLNDDLEIRDKYQAQGIDFLTSDELFHVKLLALYTGRGKTFCAISSIFRRKVPALIVSPTLKDQWLEKIIQYTNCTVDNKGITIINSSAKLDKLLKTSKEMLCSAFYITTATLLTNHIENYGTITDIIDRLGIGILCFDEFHTFYSKNVNICCHCDVANTYYLTATPGRSRYDENVIFKRLTEKIPVYGLETFKIDNYFNIRYVDYDTKPNEYEIQSCITSKGLSGILYWNYIFRSYDRKLYMISIIKMLLDKLLEEDSDIKVLIYLAKKEHIREFYTILEKLYSKTNLKFGNYTTDTKKEYKRREIKNNIIFTTIGSGGVGLDIENLRAIFSIVPYSSSITASQMLGRLRPVPGKEVYFYDFDDKGIRSMDHQRNCRNTILRVKAKTIGHKTITMEEAKDYIE